MIFTDAAAYVDTAVLLARDKFRLAMLTGKISVDKLTDTKNFVGDFYGHLEVI